MGFRIPWMHDYNASIVQELRRYEELEIAVKQLTGYNFNSLYKLFCMGYTLEPPNYRELTLTDLTKLIEEEI